MQLNLKTDAPYVSDKAGNLEQDEPSLKIGWALKSSKHYKRLSKIQKDYLLDIYNAGNQTGHKVDPVSVSKSMRKARLPSGEPIFKVDEYLTSQQIASFFRRRQQRKKALKMSKLKPRKTNRLWKTSCKIFRRTSWIPYPSAVIQSCTAITTFVIMPLTRNWTSSPSFFFKISVHPLSLTSPILK